MKLVVATGNLHKLAEYRRLLPGHKIITLKKSLDVAETGQTLKANAGLKARAYGRLTKLPVLADDTGLFVDALAGRPGIKSARWTKGDFGLARKKILTALKDVPRVKRTARFECVIAWYEPKTKKLMSFTGICRGLINQSEAGNAGFGYDSIFYSPQIKKTFGQSRPKEKDKVSHRAKALEKLKN